MLSPAHAERTERTARAVRAPIAAPAIEQFLILVVSKLEIGVGMRHVSEIVPYERVVQLPNAPAHVRGVVPLRGRVVPVVDLSIRLGLVPEATSKRSCILMLDLTLDGKPLPMGVVIDCVATLLDVPRSALQPAPKFGAEVQIECLQGIIQLQERVLPVLDVARLFAAEELQQAAALTAEGGRA